MLAAPERKSRKRLVGSPLPRICPPVPARSLWRQFHAEAEAVGVTLFPWQDTLARYTYAQGLGELWLYQEVAAVVGRQNGKTEFLVPHIVKRLRMGRRVMHAAQNREIPREVFGRVADIIEEHYPDLLFRRRGRAVLPRFASGQEQIQLNNNGHYRIVAPTKGGARGPAIDDLIVDEVRELDDQEFMQAAEPTQAASPNPQTLFLTSAGDELSVALNSIRARAGQDPILAYLEWSTAAERAADDERGWLDSNPAIGHIPGKVEFLRRMHTKHLLAGTLPIFETEYLCRWVVSLRQQFVDVARWDDLPRDVPTRAGRRCMGINMDPTGERASAVIAWRNPDQSIAVWVVADATVNPIGVDELGPQLRQVAAQHGVADTAFDPWTDADLAKHLPRSRAMHGREYANASVRFAQLVEERKLRVIDTENLISADLRRLTRRTSQGGSYMAVKANDQEPATAALAAIRAVALVAGPATATVARIF